MDVVEYRNFIPGGRDAEEYKTYIIVWTDIYFQCYFVHKLSPPKIFPSIPEIFNVDFSDWKWKTIVKSLFIAKLDVITLPVLLITNMETYSLKMWMSLFTEGIAQGEYRHSNLRGISLVLVKSSTGYLFSQWCQKIPIHQNLDLGGVPVYDYRYPVFKGRWIWTHIFNAKRQRTGSSLNRYTYKMTRCKPLGPGWKSVVSGWVLLLPWFTL